MITNQTYEYTTHHNGFRIALHKCLTPPNPLKYTLDTTIYWVASVNLGSDNVVYLDTMQQLYDLRRRLENERCIFIYLFHGQGPVKISKSSLDGTSAGIAVIDLNSALRRLGRKRSSWKLEQDLAEELRDTVTSLNCFLTDSVYDVLIYGLDDTKQPVAILEYVYKSVDEAVALAKAFLDIRYPNGAGQVN